MAKASNRRLRHCISQTKAIAALTEGDCLVVCKLDLNESSDLV
jgi:hypothetical protein